MLEAKKKQSITIGKLGAMVFIPGYYFYVGSAFGPGGLNARLNRHIKIQKKLHWHIDYLRKFLELKAIWFSDAIHKHECLWAQKLINQQGVGSYLDHFGASDCSCKTHLLYLKYLIEQNELETILATKLQSFNWK